MRLEIREGPMTNAEARVILVLCFAFALAAPWWFGAMCGTLKGCSTAPKVRIYDAAGAIAP